MKIQMTEKPIDHLLSYEQALSCPNGTMFKVIGQRDEEYAIKCISSTMKDFFIQLGSKGSSPVHFTESHFKVCQFIRLPSGSVLTLEQT